MKNKEAQTNVEYVFLLLIIYFVTFLDLQESCKDYIDVKKKMFRRVKS